MNVQFRSSWVVERLGPSAGLIIRALLEHEKIKPSLEEGLCPFCDRRLEDCQTFSKVMERPPESWVSASEAARALGVSPRRLRKMGFTPRLVGGKTFYSREAIQNDCLPLPPGTWVPAKDLGVKPAELSKWRATGKLQEGVHFLKKSPNFFLYNQEIIGSSENDILA